MPHTAAAVAHPACGSHVGKSAWGAGAARGTRRGGQARQRETRNAYPRINRDIIVAAEVSTLPKLLEVVRPLVPQMNLVNLATAMHRIARRSYTPESRAIVRKDSLLAELSTATRIILERRMRSWDTPPNSQALSNITWALATIEHVDLQLLPIVACLAAQQIAEFKPFELSGLLWALARLGQLEEVVKSSSMPVFKAAANVILRNLETFHFRCLVMIVSAFSIAEDFNVDLFDGIAPRLCSGMQHGSCEELVKIAEAYSVAGICQDELFKQIATEVRPHIAEFKPQDLGSLFSYYVEVALLEVCFLSERLLWSVTDPMLLHLLASLFTMEKSKETEAAIGRLFCESARRAPSMDQVDLEALVETCRLQGANFGTAPDRGAVVQCCQFLAQQHWSGDEDEDDIRSLHSSGYSSDSPHSPGSMISTQASLPPLKIVALDHHLKGVEIVTTEQPCTGAHALHCRTRSGVLDNGKAVETQKETENAATSDPGKRGQRCRFIFKVKNTFLDVLEEVYGTEDEEDVCVLLGLPAPLDIIPAEMVSPKELQAFRIQYQAFRTRKAPGVRGDFHVR